MEFSSFVLTFMLLFGAALSQDCTSTEFSCEDGVACIPSALVCDGVQDCLNGTDEVDCSTTNTTCPGFVCPASAFCIPSAWICDGDNDCGDMSDEEDCPVTTSTQCSGFTCNTGECLPYYWQCDSEPDCDGGEDEAGCECSGFHCPNGLCIPTGWTCDGDNDCGDMTDETEEACPCKEDEMRCPPEKEGFPGWCIPPAYICDPEGIMDCIDGSDQANCTNQPEDIDTAPRPAGRHSRPETARADSIHGLSKEKEIRAYEDRHAEKRQSEFYKNRSAKKAAKHAKKI